MPYIGQIQQHENKYKHVKRGPSYRSQTEISAISDVTSTFQKNESYLEKIDEFQSPKHLINYDIEPSFINQTIKSN